MSGAPGVNVKQYLPRAGPAGPPGATLHSEASRSSVCSPSSGGRVTLAGESDSFTGQPTV